LPSEKFTVTNIPKLSLRKKNLNRKKNKSKLKEFLLRFDGAKNFLFHFEAKQAKQNKVKIKINETQFCFCLALMEMNFFSL